MTATSDPHLRDYSLTGTDTARTKAMGLANAQ